MAHRFLSFGVQLFPASARRLHICHHRHGITGEFPCRVTVLRQRFDDVMQCVRSCVVRKHDIQKVSHTAGRLCQPAVPEFGAGNLYFQVKPVNQTILFAAFCFDTACFHRTGRLSEVNTRRFLKPLSLV